MKIKSLFLATLAALAISACSNEENPVTDGGSDGIKNAGIQFSLSFPATVNTRAENTDATGTPAEQNFTNLNFYIKYTDGTVTPHQFTKSDFVAEADGKTFKLNKTIEATAGDATFYVVMNPDNAGLPTTPTFNETVAAGYNTSLDALLTNIAQTNKFVMTGSSARTIVANQINDVSVSVSRIAAKLSESTTTTPFTVASSPEKDGAVLKIRFDNYTYANLNTDSYIFAQSNPFAPDTYFQALPTTSGVKYAVFGDYLPKTIADANSQITYCMENGSATPTKIIYQATALWGDATEGATFYVYNGIAYQTFTALNEGYTTADLSTAPISLSDASPATDFAKYDISKYEGGKCYYIQDIKTGSGSSRTSTIARNNFYKLSVINVSQLGLPETIPPPLYKPTLLTLKVEQEPWTVNTNEFSL